MSLNNNNTLGEGISGGDKLCVLKPFEVLKVIEGENPTPSSVEPITPTPEEPYVPTYEDTETPTGFEPIQPTYSPTYTPTEETPTYVPTYDSIEPITPTYTPTEEDGNSGCNPFGWLFNIFKK
jgi:hypothetical protein